MTTPVTSNQPGALDLTIQQGATYKLILTWKDSSGTPIDLTNYVALMDVAPLEGGGANLASWGTVSGEIVLGGSAGTITLTLPPATTAAYTWTSGNYDLKMTNSVGGAVTYIIAGQVNVLPSVTP